MYQAGLKNDATHDPKSRELQAAKFTWRRVVLEEFYLDRFSVYSLLGPRQVGKTAAVKMLIQGLLERRDIAKEQVMYLNAPAFTTRGHSSRFFLCRGCA